MDEVSPQTQAELELKLSDNVRELVRNHIRLALSDIEFMSSLTNRYPLQMTVIGNAYDPIVVNTVKTVITTQMNKI
jgi:hypothetical protein